MTDIFSQVRFVLVETAQPGNIGGAARAIKNMGFSDLTLVAPQVFPSERARWRAANAKDVLDTTRVVETFEQAVADCHLVIGASARERRIPWPSVEPPECAEKTVGKLQSGGKVALVFGREDSGLTNEELQRCHMHVCIPASPEYSSLNLCAAVQVVAYATRLQMLEATGTTAGPVQWDEPPATAQDLENMLQHMERVMVDTGFLDPENPRQTVTRLRRLFARIQPDQAEVAILRGFCSSVEKGLKK